jgi:hypothetical protein
MVNAPSEIDARRSRNREEPPPAAIAGRAGRPAGLTPYLCVVALVAAATIGVFYGIGFLRLVEAPAVDKPVTALSPTPDQPPAAPPPTGNAAGSAGPFAQPSPQPSEAPPLPATRPSGAAAASSEPPPAPAPSPPAPAAPIEPPPAPPPPTTAVPAPPPLSEADIAALIARGDGFFRVGKVMAARLAYIQAADAGDGQGALRLGASFDPAFLMQGAVRNTYSDPDEARSWYRRARELGVAEAEGRLRRLDRQRKAPTE